MNCCLQNTRNTAQQRLPAIRQPPSDITCDASSARTPWSIPWPAAAQGSCRLRRRKTRLQCRRLLRKGRAPAKIVCSCSWSAFGLGLEDQCYQQAKEDGCCDAAGCCRDTAGKGTDDALLFHSFGYALGQQIAKSGQGYRSSGTAPFHQIFIEDTTATLSMNQTLKKIQVSNQQVTGSHKRNIILQ